ncbi:MAG: preprotein translocase subunit SecA [Firmicutes bacterium]|nr:preprotein translocase subunit SecA [Bacillota bacterium]
MGFLEKLFGDVNSKEVNKLDKKAEEVMALEPEMAALTDDQLRAKTDEFKARLANGETLDDILVEAFAVVREASWRTLKMKHFKVQVIGGICLHEGRIAEMKTGEGKTLVATLPVYLNALEGRGVHVVTVNDYLAKRDCEWMGEIYRFLGLTVGCVIHAVEGEDRKAAYQADITYGTNNEFGFDYLRDNMVVYKERLMQRELNYAIVDEVDSILIDEARTPLIISGRGDDSSDLYVQAERFVRTLSIEDDFTVEEKDKKVMLTELGVSKAERAFGLENFGDPDSMEINLHVMNALKAKAIMKKDIDYIVKDGEIIIVDEFTGRLMYGRRYSNGLHQAIEAKEGLKVRSESKTLATITLQNYFRMYNKLAGMTGTAATEEEEFRDIYGMDVVQIPTNMPIQRIDMEDAVYASQKAKYHAVIDRIVEVHSTGQPVLVGTISIEISELLSEMLKRRGIEHEVLNAKRHELEAKIIAQAGREGAVTIATNMAGRGTDIILGGNPEFEAIRQMERDGYSEEMIYKARNYVPSDDEETAKAHLHFIELRDNYTEMRKGEQERVKALGGLCIIGTERHESRRIDNQLRGRSGRQGDPGITQFFVSLEDDLMRLFGGERVQGMMGRLGMSEDPVASGVLSKTIENAQKRVESRNFEVRKYVLQYDNVMNKQREVIYAERRKVLFNDDVREYVIGMLETLIDNSCDTTVVGSKYPEEWDYEYLNDHMKALTAKWTPLSYDPDKMSDWTEDDLKDYVTYEMKKLYDDKVREIGDETMKEVEKMVMLRVVDNHWMDHIDAMDDLKKGIGLRSLGQVDPAVAYANEGFDMFELMIAEIQEETVRFCYNVTMRTGTARREVAHADQEIKDEYHDETVTRGSGAQTNAAYQAQGGSGRKGGQLPKEAPKPEDARKPETFRRETPKIGRNDPCPCGSGKKYKNCCGRNQ